MDSLRGICHAVRFSWAAGGSIACCVCPPRHSGQQGEAHGLQHEDPATCHLARGEQTSCGMLVHLSSPCCTWDHRYHHSVSSRRSLDKIACEFDCAHSLCLRYPILHALCRVAHIQNEGACLCSLTLPCLAGTHCSSCQYALCDLLAMMGVSVAC